MTAVPRSWPSMVFSDEHDSAALSRAVKRGTLRRLGRAIYTGDIATSPEDVVRAHLSKIVAHEFPGAVIVDRSVRTGGLAVDGALFVDHPRQRPVPLPGLTIWPRRGPGPQPGDMSMPDGLFLSSRARAMLDNLATVRRSAPIRRTLEPAELEDWIDQLVRDDGPDRINAIRDEARALAPGLRRETQMQRLDALTGAALNTREDTAVTSSALHARQQGRPYDARRLDLFTSLAATLECASPHSLPALPVDAPRRALLPFYDAYFSNFIEGTEFTIDEAAEIVFDHVVPTERPEDAHDVFGTYQIVADRQEMRRVPATYDELDDLLLSRHDVLMASRADKHPGGYKTRPNRAGATEFVLPELVEGTLEQGFEIGRRIALPFFRAVYTMFLVAEVHPFADGNGRIARIMMNAELEHRDEIRVIIPTVYRNNYLSALRAGSLNRQFEQLLAVLTFAQRYTARIDFTDRATAEAELTRTNAFRDANEAEASGVRLLLP